MMIHKTMIHYLKPILNNHHRFIKVFVDICLVKQSNKELTGDGDYENKNIGYHNTVSSGLRSF
jgi:hypothetical protein